MIKLFKMIFNRRKSNITKIQEKETFKNSKDWNKSLTEFNKIAHKFGTTSKELGNSFIE